ncbi:hypothetical protein [Streptomyces sp. NPDC006739]|uniref:hypothetical protein n=1 Tax=Streptomyces sp. NPDC006739 TaxID=3364763 RepID=UPI0036995596
MGAGRSWETVAAEPEVTLRRYPAARQRAQDRHPAAARLTADPDVRWPRSADVLVLPQGRPARPDTVSRADFAVRFPGSAPVAVEETDGRCLLLAADGTPLRCRWPRRPGWATFELAASAAYTWMTSGPREGDAVRLGVRAGRSWWRWPAWARPAWLQLLVNEGFAWARAKVVGVAHTRVGNPGNRRARPGRHGG